MSDVKDSGVRIGGGAEIDNTAEETTQDVPKDEP